VAVIHHYGHRPEFVVLGGLVPELLCSNSPWQHAGTTDVDVQVDLEVAAGSVNAQRLEVALIGAGFRADNERVWRWVSTAGGTPGLSGGDEQRSIARSGCRDDLDHPGVEQR